MNEVSVNEASKCFVKKKIKSFLEKCSEKMGFFYYVIREYLGFIQAIIGWLIFNVKQTNYAIELEIFSRFGREQIECCAYFHFFLQ